MISSSIHSLRPTVHATAARALFLIEDGHAVPGLAAALSAALSVTMPGDAAVLGRLIRLAPSMAEGGAPRTVEARARMVVQAVRACQPEGPYRICGAGQGALVAYEVAVQLVGQDQPVEFVGLVGESVQCDPGAHLPQASRSLPVHLFVAADAHAADVVQPGQASADPWLAWRALLPPQQIRDVAVAGDASVPLGTALARALAEAVARAGVAPSVAAPELAYCPLLPIQTGRRGNDPLFCIPGAGDSVTGFTGLASALGPDWPLNGLQPRGVDGLLIPHTTVEAAAACYLHAILEAQPRGAVHLVGHSFGGWVAFELACLLAALGREVASLTLIDSEAPGQDGRIGGEYCAQEVANMFVDSLELAADRSLQVNRTALAQAHGAARLALVHGGAVRAGLMPARSQPDALRGCLRTFGTALRTAYQPARSYAGPVRLALIPDTRCDEAANRMQYQRMEQGWRQLAPRLSCWHGPGNHMTILRTPHAAALAHWWRAGLAHAGHGALDVRAALA